MLRFSGFIVRSSNSYLLGPLARWADSPIRRPEPFLGYLWAVKFAPQARKTILSVLQLLSRLNASIPAPGRESDCLIRAATFW
jgi:hypothetical protein